MKNALKLILGIFIGAIIIGVVVFVVIFTTSKKMVCKSNEGNITLTYNDKTITGYTAKKITYDFDKAKEYAEQVGIEQYLTEFAEWFKTNTTGTCTR